MKGVKIEATKKTLTPVQVSLDQLVEKVRERLLGNGKKRNTQRLKEKLRKTRIVAQDGSRMKKRAEINDDSKQSGARIRSEVVEEHDLYKKTALHNAKKDSYEDYVIPKKDEDALISAEKDEATLSTFKPKVSKVRQIRLTKFKGGSQSQGGHGAGGREAEPKGAGDRGTKAKGAGGRGAEPKGTRVHGVAGQGTEGRETGDRGAGGRETGGRETGDRGAGSHETGGRGTGIQGAGSPGVQGLGAGGHRPAQKARLKKNIPRRKKKTTYVAPEYYDDTSPPTTPPLKIRTENIGQFDYKDLSAESMAKLKAKEATAEPKKVKIVTNMQTRAKFSFSSPNYYAKLPRIAEKYNFNEPIPRKDQEAEKLKEIVNDPDVLINKKMPVNPQPTHPIQAKSKMRPEK